MSTTNFQRLMGLLLLVAGIVLLALVAKNASATTLTVDDDGNAQYTNIQEAINAAGNGYTIRVWEGTYYENVVVKKTIDLVGNGSEETTIDGGGSGDVVQITADWVNMSGFNVTRSGNQPVDSGMKVESDHNIISNNNCSNNFAGISLPSSSDCTITNNTCSINKIGIYLYDSSDCTITNNTCSSNNNAGIRLDSSSDCTITNNICSSNSEYGIMVSIILVGSSSDCTITNNTCENNNEGIYLYGSHNFTITKNTISNNEVGIYLGWSSQDNIAHYNNIYYNTEYGIDASNNDGYSIDATNNWWGHDSGPFHEYDNPEGQGDTVVGDVLFDPWLTESETESPSLLFSLIGLVATMSVIVAWIVHTKKKQSVAEHTSDYLPEGIVHSISLALIGFLGMLIWVMAMIDFMITEVPGIDTWGTTGGYGGALCFLFLLIPFVFVFYGIKGGIIFGRITPNFQPSKESSEQRSAQFPYQQPPQPHLYPPARPPQQYNQPQQYQQIQSPQQYAQAAPLPLPTQPDGTWICPKCGNKLESTFVFCTNCGFRR